jgi:hypothetical protein
LLVPIVVGVVVVVAVVVCGVPCRRIVVEPPRDPLKFR